MTEELYILLCEGSHDTAFLARIMRANGLKTFSKKVSDYPQVMKNYISRQLSLAKIEEGNLQELRKLGTYPSYILTTEDNTRYFMLFALGGDSRKDRRRDVIEAFTTYQSTPLMTKGEEKSVNLHIHFVFDADQKGIEQRLEEVAKEVKGIDEDFTVDEVKQAHEVSCNNVKWGFYIFADSRGKGTLEDIMIPLMCCDNDDLQNDVQEVLAKRASYNLVKTKLKADKDYDENKALVGMMGQLTKSGSANPAIIDQSGLLTDNKIQNDDVCKNIMNFLLSTDNSATT